MPQTQIFPLQLGFMTKLPDPDSLDRRSFLKKSSLGTLAGFMATGERIPSEIYTRHTDETPRETVGCAVIGFGAWGREIAATLSRNEEAELIAICDNYEVMLQRAQRSLPGISTHIDYREILDNPEIKSVCIATPTHLHREIVIAALDAGKHVYCEAPLASTIEDARAIARKAKAASGQIFQGGLIYRTEPQYRSVFQFIRSGALGRSVFARAQWHEKVSWRRLSPNRDRENALNWRLDASVSTGLIGEVGIQQLDTAAWILNSLPSAVSGFGNVLFWKDGRDVADSVQVVMEFPSGVRMIYDASLVTSFDAMYDTFYGSDSTIILRDSKAWMFKEVDAPMLGWEVYARKDKFYKETGIALLANATKLDALGQDPTADDPDAETPLFHALKAFTENYFFGPYPPIVDYQRAFEATVVAIKANEAVVGNTRIEYEPEWFVV